MTKLEPHQLSLVSLATLWAVSLLLGWRALVDTASLSVRNGQYTYLLLILPVSAAMIFLEWRPLRTAIKPNFRAGVIGLMLAAMIASFALGWPFALAADVQLAARMLALVVWWIGAFLLCFGLRASRLVLFPLCFLFGLVPLPQIALNSVVALLQYGSAWAAHALFAACGVPVVQNGVLVSIPGLSLQVAQECSSMRSSSMLLVTTMVLAQLLLRSPWRKALVIALAIPLSIAKNGLRIFTIAMLGTRVDPGFLTGKLHREGGVVFFAIILAVIFALLWALRKGEGSASRSGEGKLHSISIAD
jgi:exosortase